MSMSKEERARTPFIDYLTPIIADGDTGFGGATATVKLCKLFAERGAAGVHIEDQSSIIKKCGHMSGNVLVSVSEQVNRLIVAHLQFDVMGVDTVLISRTDAVDDSLIQSNIDPQDHGYILGITNPAHAGRSLASLLFERTKVGKSGPELQAIKDAWMGTAKLMTFDELVKEKIKSMNVGEG